jgi:hypothetical protein
MATYWIVVNKDYDHDAVGFMFLTPSAAESYLRRHHSPFPHHYRVRPATWQERERSLADSSAREPVPWSNLPFWAENRHIWADLFPYVSDEDPTMIAFTASPEDGERDRQTRTRPGRFLSRFFQGVLTPKQIAYYAEWWTNGGPPNVAEGENVRFASSPLDIARVYRECVATSCMDSGHFDDDHDSPVRIYGAGDLQLAYLVESDGEDEAITARALVWKENKVLGRVYPEPHNGNAGERLRSFFEHAGYASLYAASDGFEGARLLKIQKGRSYVMPYLDVGYGVDRNDDPKFWRMTRHPDYACDSTDGLLEPEEYYECDRCGESVDEDDLGAVVTDVTFLGNGTINWLRTHSESYCETCRNRRTFYCDYAEQTFSDYQDYVGLANGNTIHNDLFVQRQGYESERTGEYYLPDEDAPVEVIIAVDLDGDVESETWAECELEDARVSWSVTQSMWCARGSRIWPGCAFTDDDLLRDAVNTFTLAS